jgi:hypothetical protein
MQTARLAAFRAGLGLIVVAACVAGAVWYLQARNCESTDSSGSYRGRQKDVFSLLPAENATGIMWKSFNASP